VADAAGSYTVTVQLVFDRPPAADRTRWGGIYVGVTTDECPDDVDTSTGYLVALRWTGDLAVFGQPAAGTGMACLGSTPTSAIVTPVLSAALPAGAAVTSLPVHALPADVRPGHQFLLPTGQVATLAAVTAAGGRALPIERLVPSAPLAAGTALAQTVTIAVAKTPAGLTVSRTDDGVTAGYADSTWSGGYLFLRNDGDDVAAISCASLTISAPRRQS
jgi:hypothetical protein